MLSRRDVMKVSTSSVLAALAVEGLSAAQPATTAAPQVQGVKAMTFDVFGTVVDWRASIIREGQILGESKGLKVDWARFADRWRAGYGPA